MRQTKELLKIVKILIENKIYYQKIKLSNLMLDKKGNLRLVGFCPAQQTHEIDVENYLDNVGNIMMNLYGVNDSFNSLPKIADNGNEFIVGLMNPNRDYRFSFEDAMQHEYIQNIFCEPNLQLNPYTQLQYRKLSLFLLQQRNHPIQSQLQISPNLQAHTLRRALVIKNNIDLFINFLLRQNNINYFFTALQNLMENKLKLQVMDYNLYLECIFNQQPSYVICDQHNLKVKTKNDYFKFEISLNLHLRWIYVESQINEVRFENHSLKGPIENLEKLKNCLDCRVMYLGAAQLYEQYLPIKEDEFKKTLIVKSKATGEQYYCKAYKKEVRENEYQFVNELKILRILKGNKNVVRVFEVFESKHNYYMIMEYTIRNLEQDYTLEENQIIIKEILNILDDLNQKSIIYGQIRPKNFMFNKDNVMKLIGFSKTQILKEVVESEDIVNEISLIQINEDCNNPLYL